MSQLWGGQKTQPKLGFSEPLLKGQDVLPDFGLQNSFFFQILRNIAFTAKRPMATNFWAEAMLEERPFKRGDQTAFLNMFCLNHAIFEYTSQVIFGVFIGCLVVLVVVAAVLCCFWFSLSCCLEMWFGCSKTCRK